ncbi:MAG: thiamine pyrophosphate-dependent enzyme [Desulfobacterales bacterium]|jgi:indolepyruvate ferredoxin oxidoreductase alpha subunit
MKALLSGNEAIARGAYESGIEVAAGYPGTPSSEILENVSTYRKIYSEWSVNEKVAMDVAAGAAYSGRRALVTTKQVGMNVLSDSLFYTAYTGLEAGLVVVTADDPGMFSSQNEQDNRHYAKLGKFPMLEPADSQECKDYVVKGIEISEQFDTPVVVRTTMRTSHSKSVVELGDDPAAPGPVGPFTRDMQKYNCMCLWSKKRHPVLEQRLLDLAEFAETYSENRFHWGDRQLGIIASGVVYEYACQVFPQASFLKLGMVYPLPKKKIKQFAEAVKTILIIEELDPFIEEQVRAMGIDALGKEIFPACDELLPQTIRKLARKHSLLPEGTKAPVAPHGDDLPGRSPVLCAGCPHRSTFYLLNKMKLPVAGDIGCYNLGTLPPFNAQHTMGSMGASIGVLHGMGKSDLPEPAVCTIGDGTFFHAGIPPLLNMVHNHGRGTVIIMDNSTTAMTGHQDHPGNDYTLMGAPSKKVDIEPLVRALGVEKVISVDAFDVKAISKALKDCTTHDGAAVLIAKGPCVFVSRNPQPAYCVDADMCVACGTCARAGCPATIKIEEINPKTKQKKAGIDPVLCIGCDICRQICPTGAIQRPE